MQNPTRISQKNILGTLLQFVLFLMLMVFPSLTMGQDTLRVTYHDFNWQHPDFGGPPSLDPVQQKCNSGPNSGILQDILPADKIPVASGTPHPTAADGTPLTGTALTRETAECKDLDITSWFAPTSATTGFYKTFPGNLIETSAAAGGDGKFAYKDLTFFPIDTLTGAQLYNAPGSTTIKHNNLFCLESHVTFPYTGGEKFTFTGDDDVWLYINSKLAIDLGGLHGALTKVLDLDADAGKLGITVGGTYDFDFYYCERQYSASSININTNIPIAFSKVAPVEASPYQPVNGTHFFTSSLDVSLSTATPNPVAIYYTTNGSTPDSGDHVNSHLYVSGSPIPVIGKTTIKAIAYKAGYVASDVSTFKYDKTFKLSTLEILNENGSTVPYLTEKDSKFTIKVTTTQAGLNSISDSALTKQKVDKEVFTQNGPPLQEGENLVFSGTYPLSIISAAAATGNGTSEAAAYDTLTVRWRNPSDANDVAVATMFVRPAPVQAKAYFSTNAAGTDTVDQFAGTETTIYLFVLDEVLPAGLTPKVTLVTTPKLGSGRNPDSLVVNLVATGTPGKYRATIPVDINPIRNLGDANLQLAVEDEIKGTYSDPLDLESAPPVIAGYGIAPEIEGSLQFTDANGNILPPGVYYSPDAGKLFLTYSDDWAGGLIPTKSVTLTIDNNNGNATADAETFNVTLNIAKHTGSKGVWEGSINLHDGPTITPNNNTADTYVLGKAHASVTSHSKAGNALDAATDDLLIAYANVDPTVTVEDTTKPGEPITRVDSTIKITILDQSLSSSTDTLFATLSCTESNDIYADVMLIETSPGVYVSEIIGKSEGAVIVDNKLQCKSTDEIKVVYTDPVYGTPKTVSVILNEPVTTKLFFTPSETDNTVIGSVDESSSNSFVAVIVAHDPSVNKVDTLTVTFTTVQGEHETFKAVETGPATGKFTVVVPYGFVTTSVPSTPDQKLEGQLTPQILDNSITVVGSVTTADGTTTSNIKLVAAFDPVVKAYIKDTDGNGQADKVYVEFERPLAHLPSTLDAQWNDTTAAKPVPTGKLSFLEGSDSTIVVADYASSPFTKDLTAPAGGQSPKAILPSADALFAGQRPVLEDSIGPVIVTAIKIPTNPNTLAPKDPGLNYDTLVVKLSEPLKTGTDLKEMIKFSTSCSDYSNAITLVAIQNPTIDANGNYIVIIDNSTGPSPQTGNCVFLNAEPGKYTDNSGNAVPQHGVKLEGSNRRNIIQVFRGFPPVAGFAPGGAEYAVVTNDNYDPKKGGLAEHSDPNNPTSPLVLNWVPPVGYPSSGSSAPYVPYKVANLKELADMYNSGATADNTVGEPVPLTVSAVQVITTAPYIAHIAIFDLYGNFVNSSVQVFGGKGEMRNLERLGVPKGAVSYLVWDMKTKKGELAGNGVYIWKVRFEFVGGKQEVQYTRTGVMRKKT